MTEIQVVTYNVNRTSDITELITRIKQLISEVTEGKNNPTLLCLQEVPVEHRDSLIESLRSSKISFVVGADENVIVGIGDGLRIVTNEDGTEKLTSHIFAEKTRSFLSVEVSCQEKAFSIITGKLPHRPWIDAARRLEVMRNISQTFSETPHIVALDTNVTGEGEWGRFLAFLVSQNYRHTSSDLKNYNFCLHEGVLQRVLGHMRCLIVEHIFRENSLQCKGMVVVSGGSLGDDRVLWTTGSDHFPTVCTVSFPDISVL